jgi:hypothetical protein
MDNTFKGQSQTDKIFLCMPNNLISRIIRRLGRQAVRQVGGKGGWAGRLASGGGFYGGAQRPQSQPARPTFEPAIGRRKKLVLETSNGILLKLKLYMFLKTMTHISLEKRIGNPSGNPECGSAQPRYLFPISMEFNCKYNKSTRKLTVMSTLEFS